MLETREEARTFTAGSRPVSMCNPFSFIRATMAWYKAVTDRINYSSPLPMVRFDPARESIWSLPKR